MDQKERLEDGKLSIDKDARINVVVNTPDSEEDSIDLGRVFHNMKVKRRVYAWVLVLCLVVGLCAPVVLYYMNKPMLIVASAVTLKYDVPMVELADGRLIPLAESEEEDPEIVYVPVTDLTAPDGSPLDLNQITSSYVLSRAMEGLELSQPLTLTALRQNISIERVLTEESRQAQELASKMVEDKNSEAYGQMQAVEMKYDCKFTVRLTNGFGEEDSRVKLVLQDGELSLLLDRILKAYNDYLVQTYADRQMPDDEISVIATEKLDLLESLEKLRTASDDLLEYCESRPDSVRAYRSSRDGRSLNDWMQTLRTQREVSIDYLYSYVYSNSIVKKPEEVKTFYNSRKQLTEQSLKDVSAKIAADEKMREDYEKPQVIVSMQESGGTMTTKQTTDQFNEIVLRLDKNIARQAELKTELADLEQKIAALETVTDASSEETIEQMDGELAKVMDRSRETYASISALMEEIISSPFYTNYAEHTVPQGKAQSFFAANLKNMVIGGVAGAVVACGLWFLAALAPEFRRGRKDDDPKAEGNGKEAARA